MSARRGLLVGVLVVAVLAGAAFWRRPFDDASLTALVQRGDLTATITTSGTLRPVQSITYRSPVPGRDAEIRELAAEGTRVNAGDLLVRFGTTELEADLDRARQELRQAQMDLQVAEGEWEEAAADVKSVSEGEGALTVDEARTTLQRAEKKVERLRQEYGSMKPLFDKGFITRDELAKSGDQLEQAEDDLALARKRTGVMVDLTHPREQKRASLLLAQKASQLGLARTRVQEGGARVDLLTRLIAECRVTARGPGLVVHEELLTANPRRKVRVGDRVYASQGVVTIPEVDRMRVEASVGEAEVHRVRPGQRAEVRVEAFPNLRLSGTVGRVGTLATTSINRPFEEKRFDLLIELDTANSDLRPEMTARADVVVGTRTGVVLVPVTAIFQRQGAPVAYVLGASGPEARPVTLGESSGQATEVLSGLSEGDRVALTEPANAHVPQPR